MSKGVVQIVWYCVHRCKKISFHVNNIVTQLPSMDCYTAKGNFILILWATDHIALSDIFVYLINVLTPYD